MNAELDRSMNSATNPVVGGNPETPASGGTAKFDISDEDRESLHSVYGTSIVSSLLSMQWKDRKDALTKALNTLNSKVIKYANSANIFFSFLTCA